MWMPYSALDWFFYKESDAYVVLEIEVGEVSSEKGLCLLINFIS